QIGSFNQFLETNIQEIINENKEITIVPDKKYGPTQKETSNFKYEVIFGQLHISHLPYFKEKDDFYNPIFPNLARIRNLTYESDLLLDITSIGKEYNEALGKEIVTEDPKTVPKNFIGKIPIMVRSKYCTLAEMSDT
ncbi:MAG: hypothetical protein ACKO96_36055, partial [Flammeovirgaceae bacterium]